MRLQIIFFGFMVLCASSSWAMDANKKRAKRPAYYEDFLQYKRQSLLSEDEAHIGLANKYQKDIKIIEDLLAEISGKNIESSKVNRFCKHTISGNDWFVLLERSTVLKVNEPAIIPWMQWEKYNCNIKLGEITHDEVKIIIIPDAFPLLGDHSLPDATWKAVVWLERPLKLAQEVKSVDVSHSNESEQIRQCRKNLEFEAAALKEKLIELLTCL